MTTQVLKFLAARNRVIHSGIRPSCLGQASAVGQLADGFRWQPESFNPLQEILRILEQAIVFAREGTVALEALPRLSDGFIHSRNYRARARVATVNDRIHLEKAAGASERQAIKNRLLQPPPEKQPQIVLLAEDLRMVPRSSSIKLAVLLEQALSYGMKLREEATVTEQPSNTQRGTAQADYA